MICAADELGLSDDHSGVMELDPSCRIGEPFARYLDGDVVLDIAVTPNRPDVLSHLGMARELAGGEEIHYPEQHPVVFSKTGTLVDVLDSVACPYYTGVVIRGIKVAESPAWLRKKLESIGLRPKNNIVDITNYILHGLGQPLHAFDLGKLSGERVVVRSDMRGEFIAINQQLCQVEPGMPVICDSEKPVALAGVMGGL